MIREAIGTTRRVDHKSPINLVTEVDRAAERLIVAGLRRAYPGDHIVAEESESTRVRDGKCWYIDPIDGTTNFVHDLPHCAVSIALAEGPQMQAAVVYDPCKDELFEAVRGAGAKLNGAEISVSTASRLADSLLVTGFPYDRREHVDFYLSYFKAFMLAARDVRRLGSASLDLCYVAAGRFDGFWEWKLHPWDTAAGWLVLEEAGGRVTDFDGSDYDAWLPRVLATNGAIHDECASLLRRLPAAAPA